LNSTDDEFDDDVAELIGYREGRHLDDGRDVESEKEVFEMTGAAAGSSREGSDRLRRLMAIFGNSP
jgi:hypothetical protein